MDNAAKSDFFRTERKQNMDMKKFGLWAAVVVAVVMAALLLVLRGKRFAGPPVGEEIARRKAEIATAEAAIAQGS